MNTNKKKLVLLHIGIINLLLNLYPLSIIDITYDNQSFIGNTLSMPFYLLLWSCSSVIGFYFYSIKIWKHFRIRYNQFLHFIFCFGLITASIIPYSVSMPFIINDLHVWIAVICTIGFAYEWIRLYNHPLIAQTKFYKQVILVFIFSAFIVFQFGSVTSLCEIIFSLLVNIILGIWYMAINDSV